MTTPPFPVHVFVTIQIGGNLNGGYIVRGTAETLGQTQKIDGALVGAQVSFEGDLPPGTPVGASLSIGSAFTGNQPVKIIDSIATAQNTTIASAVMVSAGIPGQFILTADLGVVITPVGIITPPVPPPGPPGFPPPPKDWWNTNSWIEWLGKVIQWDLTALLTGAAAALKPLIDYLWSLLPSWIRDAWTSTEKWFGDLLAGFEKFNVLQRLDGILNFLENWPLWGGRVLNVIAKSTGHEIHHSPQFIEKRRFAPAIPPSTDVPWPWSGMVDAFRAITGDWEAQAERWAKLAGTATKPGSPLFKGTVEADMKPFAAAQHQAMLDAFDVTKFAKSPITPEEAKNAAIAIASASVGVGIAVWIADAVAEAASLGQYKALKHFDDIVLAKLGITALGAKLIGVPLDVGVFRPSEHFYNSLFRTTLPAPPQADRLLFWKKLTPDEWKALYNFYGWTNERRDAWNVAMHRVPRDRMLIKLFDAPLGIEKYFVDWMVKGGYDEETANILLGIAVKLSLADEVKAREAQVVKDFADGWLTLEAFRGILGDLGKTKDELDLSAATGQEALSRSIRDQRVKILRDQFVHGKLTEDTFTQKLVALGLQSDRFSLILDEAKEDIKPSDVKILTLPQLRTIYIDNDIDELRYRTELVRRQIDPADVELLVLEADNARYRDERTALATQALDDFQVLHADPEIYAGQLKDLNFNDEEISLRVARAEEQYSRTVAKGLVDIYTKGFESDKLTLDEFQGALDSITPSISSRRKKDIIVIASTRKKPAEAFGG